MTRKDDTFDYVLDLPVKTVHPDEAHRARLKVCEVAESPAEARRLLLMLGLAEQRQDGSCAAVLPPVKVLFPTHDPKGDTTRTATPRKPWL